MTDLRLAFRAMRKNPAFTVTALITLALGVGATTAVFSVVKAVLLKPLPYASAERLVTIATTDGATATAVVVDFTTTQDLRERTKSFEAMSLYRQWRTALVGDGEPELVNGMRVSANYFDLLGVKMQLGRTFQTKEDRPERWNKAVILSHSIWMRRFGEDPGIVGRTIRLNESAFTVVGVLPAGFQPTPLSQGDRAREVFAPLGYEVGKGDACRGCQHLRLVARLKDGVSLPYAAADLNTAMGSIVRDYPQSYNPNMRVLVTGLRESVLGKMAAALWLLAGAVGFVLLIVCANIANLLLAKATGRGREMALRVALGAGRGRLVRQLLAESLTLGVMGGVAGAALAAAGVRAVAVFGPREVPRIAEAAVDVSALLFALATSLAAGLLCGLAPAFRITRIDLTGAMKDGTKSTAGRTHNGLRNALVTAEIALAFLLVMGAALLGRSLINLLNVDAGFDPRNVITLNTYVYANRYAKNPESELGYYRQVFERLRGEPGIDSVAMVSTLPLASFDQASIHVQEKPLVNDQEAPAVDRYSVSPEYFRVMRIPIRRGRGFSEADRAGAVPAAVVSESAARALFGGDDPIGKHIQLGRHGQDLPWLTIVGVCGDVRQYGLDRVPAMSVYVSQAQYTDFSFLFVARTNGDPSKMGPVVRRAFLAVDKTQPVYDVMPMESYLRASLAERSFILTLLTMFGVMALVLAAVGVYGVISYGVSARTREIGIRMALGARWTEVAGMVLREGVLLAAAGVGIGFAGLLAVTRFLAAMLYEVQVTNVATALGAGSLLATVALVAALIPARRAAKVDPMVALRYE